MAQEICVVVSDEERLRLEASVGDRNRLLKHVQHARIFLLSAKRRSVLQVVVRAGVSRPAVWRGQRRYAEAGVEGLLRDKTRPPGKRPVRHPISADMTGPFFAPSLAARTLQEPREMKWLGGHEAAF
jgi:hypothetical protein